MEKGEFDEQGCHSCQAINDKGMIKVDDLSRRSWKLGHWSYDMGTGRLGGQNDPYCGHLCLNGVMNPLTLTCGSPNIPHIMRSPCLGLCFEKDFENMLKLLYKRSFA